MRRFLAYALPVVFYFCVSAAGGYFSSAGVGEWYESLSKPWYTPPGVLIGSVWTVIYILCAASLILLAVTADRHALRRAVPVYVLNGVLNAGWSYIFFTRHMLALAVVDAALIWATVLAMTAMVWPYSKRAGVLLIPYILWSTFATYLSWAVYRLN